MRLWSVFCFGILPCIGLSAAAFFAAAAGFATVLDYPQLGVVLILWALLGLAGAWALVRAWIGRWTSNTVPALIGGILATLPIVIGTLMDLDFDSLAEFLWLILSAGPIVSALYLMRERGII